MDVEYSDSFKQIFGIHAKFLKGREGREELNRQSHIRCCTLKQILIYDEHGSRQ